MLSFPQPLISVYFETDSPIPQYSSMIVAFTWCSAFCLAECIILNTLSNNSAVSISYTLLLFCDSPNKSEFHELSLALNLLTQII